MLETLGIYSLDQEISHSLETGSARGFVCGRRELQRPVAETGGTEEEFGIM